MRREERGHGHGEERGVPDGLLVGVLAFLLGMTMMVWTSTGFAGLFSRGSWPNAVTFAHTPLAMRHLIGEPHDLTGAWPATPADQLSGWGLFWGLFIGQLLLLVVLTVFVIGTVARWRAGRVRRGVKAGLSTAPFAAEGERAGGRETFRAETTTHEQPPTHEQPRPTMAPLAAEGERAGGREISAAPTTQGHPLTVAAQPLEQGERAGGREIPPQKPPRPVRLGPAETRHPQAVQAIQDAEGPAMVVTSNPRTWSDTKDARAKLGPVLLYNPAHLCDTPARLHWSPSTGCEDKATAAARAVALLAPVRPTAKVDQPMADVAETLLRSYLHAAAVEGKPFRHVHRWSQGMQVQDAVRALRTNPKAASGAAGELEAVLTSHSERRDIAQELTARALSALSTVNVRESCTPNRSDTLTLDSFVNEGGTLYVVGEPIEDPRANPGAMPLLTALASSVVERGRGMAERSSSGRLDPPLTLVLDDVAAVAPLPQLPDLLSTGATRGLPTLALLRSQEQARSRWPQYDLPL
ncbi:type IV secretory system conjugative DNA transfer family protein [Streptomyces sp. NPDC005808]|uniref:type IV secretory system conjugative DNA transfer family protein n=1 Tax=Streptomyces sp. NPDC005808 TaxID=3364734 RepID=UPI0036AFB261